MSSATTTATELAGPAKTAATQRTRLISTDMLAEHDTIDSLWVSYKGRVYDVTEFAPDHPGGDDLIMRFAGKDMGDIMEDPVEHSHSESAFDLLEEHYIGRLPLTEEEHALVAPKEEGGADFTGKDSTILITDDFKPRETDFKRDYKNHAFLDLSKPLIPQMWSANFSKDFYLMQVHSPRHLKGSARLFGPWYLEMFTKTPWYIVPIIWLPITAAIYFRSAQQMEQWTVADVSSTASSTMASPSVISSVFQNSTAAPLASSTAFNLLTDLVRGTDTAFVNKYLPNDFFHLPSLSSFALVAPLFLTGIFIWSFLEHTMHRWVFHIDNLLPDRQIFFLVHFLLHGVHHFLPMDPLRLVMPPLLFTALSYPFTQLAHALFPNAIANGLISGAFFMYVGYDCTHYFLHHTKLPEYVKKLKAHHLQHHYVDYEGRYGVTSTFWDWVFSTDGVVRS